MEKLVDWQINEGIDALVICGSTGEKATLNDNEHRDVLRCAVKTAAGRVPIIAGTGSNDTAHAVWMTKEAGEIGCDGMLVCTPYYNKSTQKGLVTMFETIAAATEKPIIVYNVPSRCGIGIKPETYAEIAKIENVTGIKEANGDISEIAKTMALVGNDISLYSGNDDQIVPIMSLGGQGVVSVISNLMPKRTAELCKTAFSGDFAAAAKEQLELLPLMNALFSEVNPIPVKAAMAKMGFLQGLSPIAACSYGKGAQRSALQAYERAGNNLIICRNGILKSLERRRIYYALLVYLPSFIIYKLRFYCRTT